MTVPLAARITTWWHRVTEQDKARDAFAPWLTWITQQGLEELARASSPEAAMVKLGTMLADKARKDAHDKQELYRSVGF